MIRVFVYGTLKRGQPNHHLIENVENGKALFIGEGKTVVKYPLIIASRCNIPFLLPVEGTGEIIHGEMFDVDEPMLKRLDALEGHPAWYKREEIPIAYSNGFSKCWCYMLEHFKPDLLHLPYLEKFDFHSMPKDRQYIAASERSKHDTERFWIDVKRPEFYISPLQFEELYPYAKDKY